MNVSIIAAMGENRVIGANGKIPWHLPADFKRFKELTMGHPIVAGRKTFESIGKPLLGRTNIVVTSNEQYRADGCLIAHSLEDALKLAEHTPGGKEIFVIGGGEIYKMALPKAQKIYLTRVRGSFDGDTFFPEFDQNDWQRVSSEEHKKDEKNQFEFTFTVYERKK
jgi:dihydrofolate reductase